MNVKLVGAGDAAVVDERPVQRQERTGAFDQPELPEVGVGLGQVVVGRDRDQALVVEGHQLVAVAGVLDVERAAALDDRGSAGVEGHGRPGDHLDELAAQGVQISGVDLAGVQPVVAVEAPGDHHDLLGTAQAGAPSGGHEDHARQVASRHHDRIIGSAARRGKPRP